MRHRPPRRTDRRRLTIAREEIVRPVLSVIPAEDERDAVRIANYTIYGLNASVFTDDLERAPGNPRGAAWTLRRSSRLTLSRLGDDEPQRPVVAPPHIRPGSGQARR